MPDAPPSGGGNLLSAWDLGAGHTTPTLPEELLLWPREPPPPASDTEAPEAGRPTPAVLASHPCCVPRLPSLTALLLYAQVQALVSASRHPAGSLHPTSSHGSLICPQQRSYPRCLAQGQPASAQLVLGLASPPRVPTPPQPVHRSPDPGPPQGSRAPAPSPRTCPPGRQSPPPQVVSGVIFSAPPRSREPLPPPLAQRRPCPADP